jgi:hypothetical protein
MIISDFEAYQMEVDKPHAKGQMKAHLPSGFAMKMVSFSNYIKPHYYIYEGDGTPDDVMDKFFKKLDKWGEKINNIRSTNHEMNLTVEEEQSFRKAKACHICCELFNKENIKVRDHSHQTGKYLGAAHQGCNLNRVPPNFIPLFWVCLCVIVER